MSDATGNLLAELVHEHTDTALTRLRLSQTLTRSLRGTLVPRGLLRSWPHVCTARRVWASWRLYLRLRNRRRVHSWIRRRVRNDETPVLVNSSWW